VHENDTGERHKYDSGDHADTFAREKAARKYQS
jgi:hypothetical protein